MVIDIFRAVEGNQLSLPQLSARSYTLCSQLLRHKDPSATRSFDRRVAALPAPMRHEYGSHMSKQELLKNSSQLSGMNAPARPLSCQDCRVTFDHLPGQIERNKTGRPARASEPVLSLCSPGQACRNRWATLRATDRTDAASLPKPLVFFCPRSPGRTEGGCHPDRPRRPKSRVLIVG